MPTGRQSGQRRYRTPALRRLVFIKMLQDAGLSLDDISGVLHADSVADWKAIVARRLETLTAEIQELERARTYLEGRIAVPVRSPGDGLQDHGRRDRPPPRVNSRRPPEGRRVGSRTGVDHVDRAPRTLGRRTRRSPRRRTDRRPCRPPCRCRGAVPLVQHPLAVCRIGAFIRPAPHRGKSSDPPSRGRRDRRGSS